VPVGVGVGGTSIRRLAESAVIEPTVNRPSDVHVVGRTGLPAKRVVELAWIWLSPSSLADVPMAAL